MFFPIHIAPHVTAAVPEGETSLRANNVMTNLF